MSQRFLRFQRLPFIVFGLLLALPCSGVAQQLPSAADAARITHQQTILAPDRQADHESALPQNTTDISIPENAKNIHFTLQDIKLTGATAFPPEELTELYAPYLHTDITLDVVYTIAAHITEHYRAAGYFLSLCYLPPQNIQDGIVTLNVVEGHIAEVTLNDPIAQTFVVRGYIQQLTKQHPLRADDMESFLLRLNDLPGVSFRSILSPMDNAQEGEVQLTLVPTPKTDRSSVSFDNNSSRFLGPHELSATYTKSFLPLQQTSVSGLVSLPLNKLQYATLEHNIMVAPDITVGIKGGITKAKPGFTLTPSDIASDSETLAFSLAYQAIRQRDKNLSFQISLDGRNSHSDITSSPLTRDRVRALRASFTFDASDAWQGYNVINVTLSHGLNGLGSCKKGDLNLSRARATPDFSKAEFSLSRLQSVTNTWSLLATASGQVATGALYSSEEFGYGGQAFGRAFDPSEITGDHGIAGALEVRYGGWNDLQPLNLQPYAFYDIGAIWNEDRGQSSSESGASVGLGLRFASQWNQTGNLTIAWPLTRDVAAPLYGNDKKAPRLMMQVTQSF